MKKNLIFKDLFVLTRTGRTIINQKLVDSMFVPGAVAIQKWNFPLFGHKRDAGMGQYLKGLRSEQCFDASVSVVKRKQSNF